MSKYFAQIENDIVKQVVVADSKKWCVEKLGGEWVETFIDHPTKKYAGIGGRYDKKTDDFEPLIVSPVGGKNIVSGNIFIRPNTLVKGDSIPGHKHFFDHTTIFFTGSFLVEYDGKQETYTAPSHLLVSKNVQHKITALEDGTFWCVYAHRNENGEVVQEVNEIYKSYF